MTSKLTSIADEKIEDVIKMARESAKIYGVEWDSALIAESPGNNVHGITSDHIKAVVVRTADDSLHSSWLCDYLESVSPAFVIAALRELQERRKADRDSEPVAYTDERNLGYIDRGRETAYLWGKQNSEASDVALYRHAQQPVVPATLPCSVELKPGLIIGKGCKTETLLTALRRRADYNADIDAMTPEERAEHDASIKAFKAMLAAAPQPQNAPQNIPEIIPGWIPVSEQLPEECGRYWCYVEEQTDLGKSHYQWNCSWNGERWLVEGEDGGIVTHWMPLPAAPQEVK